MERRTRGLYNDGLKREAEGAPSRFSTGKQQLRALVNAFVTHRAFPPPETYDTQVPLWLQTVGNTVVEILQAPMAVPSTDFAQAKFR